MRDDNLGPTDASRIADGVANAAPQRGAGAPLLRGEHTRTAHGARHGGHGAPYREEAPYGGGWHGAAHGPPHGADAPPYGGAHGEPRGADGPPYGDGYGRGAHGPPAAGGGPYGYGPAPANPYATTGGPYGRGYGGAAHFQGAKPRKQSGVSYLVCVSSCLAVGFVCVSFSLFKHTIKHELFATTGGGLATQLRDFGAVATEIGGGDGDGGGDGVASQTADWNHDNPLSIPRGQPPNLPSIRVEDKWVEKYRKFYGGKGDKAHLGGFTELDSHGISPHVWRHMIQNYTVKSVIDVACGRGISTSWFGDHGVDVLCVEGSHDAKLHSVLDDPDAQMVEHDFSRGPWWPARTYDAAWAVEFLEHVGLNHHFNYVQTLRKAALLFVTSSRRHGWHHVEVHEDMWWIQKFEAYGFRYNQKMTDEVRRWGDEERNAQEEAFQGKTYNAQHVRLSMKVFVNPVVAALPAHAHLFQQHGCYAAKLENGNIQNKPCDSKLESALPKEFLPLTLTPEMDTKWKHRIQQALKSRAK